MCELFKYFCDTTRLKNITSSEGLKQGLGVSDKLRSLNTVKTET